MRRGSRVLCFAWLVLAGRVAAAGGALPAPNALLVVDANNQRVLRVALAGGAVTVFSPPAGAQTNLLTSPRGIGVGPDGTIFVTNYVENTLVEIDPATGAQFPVEGLYSGPPDVGVGPLDVGVNPRDPAPGFLPTLGVASLGGLHQVVRNALDATGTLLAPYPSPYDPYLGRFVVARDPGTNDPIDYVVSVDAGRSVLWYQGAADAFTPLPYTVGLDRFTGLDAPRTGPWDLVVTFRDEAGCASGVHGVQFYPPLPNVGTVRAGYVECPGPVAFDGTRDLLLFVGVDTSPEFVIGHEHAPTGGYPYVHAILPDSAHATDIALAYVPEPSASALALAALAALVRRRWRSCVR